MKGKLPAILIAVVALMGIGVIGASQHTIPAPVSQQLAPGKSNVEGVSITAPTVSTTPQVSISPIPTIIPKPTPTYTPIPTPKITLAPTVEPTATPTSAPVTGYSTTNTQPASDCSSETALCNDGTCSDATHHQGACSHHGGVAQFYR